MFLASIFGFMLFGIFRAMFLQSVVQRSITNMHQAMTEVVIRSKILFFDSNPSGRIISRFAKDMGILDFNLPVLGVYATQGIFRVTSVFITVAALNYYLLVPLALGVIYMLYITK